MGLIGWTEAHPFTIASVAKTPEGLVLMCKNAGGWTNRLYELAKVAGYGCEDGDESRTVTVMLDGPYGMTSYPSSWPVLKFTWRIDRWYGAHGICELLGRDVCCRR